MTDQAYPGLSKAEDLFYDLVWRVIIDAGLAVLFAEVPFLAFPVVKQVITKIVYVLTDKLYSALRLTVDLTAISLVNEAHEKAFDHATVALKIIAIDKGIESDEYKAAKENAKNALAKFVHFGGAA